MGSVSSTPANAAQKVTQDQVAARINQLQELFEKVNMNDSSVLLEMINNPKTQTKLPEDMKKKITDMLNQIEMSTNVRGKPTDFKAFLDTITKEDKTMMESKYLTAFDDGTKTKIRSALDPFFTLNAKYRYFLYKYIQLNMLFVGYTKKTQEIMKDVTLYIKSAYQTRHESDQEMLNKFIELTKALASGKAGDMTEADFKQVIELAESTMQTLKVDNEDLKKRVADYETAKTIDILKMLIDSNDQIRSEVSAYIAAPRPASPVSPQAPKTN